MNKITFIRSEYILDANGKEYKIELIGPGIINVYDNFGNHLLMSSTVGEAYPEGGPPPGINEAYFLNRILNLDNDDN